MRTLVATLALAFAAGLASAAKIEIVQDHPDALYRAGEEAVFTVTVKDEAGAPLTCGTATWNLDNFGSKALGKGRADLAEGNPFSVRGTMAEEGFLRLRVNAASNSAVWGVGYDVGKIRQAEPCPADFDAYWAGEKARLAREVPLDARCVRDAKRSTAAYDTYLVSFATFGGKRVHGLMSVPTDKSRAPYRLRVSVPGAGPGWLTAPTTPDEIRLVMSVHGFETAQTADEQKRLMAEQNRALAARYGLPNKNAYCALSGIAESREDYYFHDVMLGIDRAVDWASARDDVDPNRVVYWGSSQGGGFGLFLNVLNTHFTKAMVAVCALTGHYGFRQGRQEGWPHLIMRQAEEKCAAAAKYAAYYDGVNFAARVRTPIRFVVGFADMTCPPADVYAAYNVCPSADKAIVNAIGSGHSWNRWYEANRRKPGVCPDLDDWLRKDEPKAQAPTFYAAFDRDFTAETADGTALGEYSAEVLWENLATYLRPGVSGSAALVGTGRAKDECYHVVWPNKGYLKPESGSVSFWACPLDWSGSSTNFHVFFRADGADAECLLYYYPNHTFKFILGPSRKVEGRSLATEITVPARDWKENAWHQVVATWGEKGMSLYLDGTLRGRKPFTPPKSAFRRFGAGGVRPLEWVTAQDHSLVDELRLDGAPLAEAEVRTDYLAKRPTAEAAANPLLAVTEEDLAEMKKPELWRNNDVGKERAGEVPPPWTPVTWDGATFGCWGRTVRFGRSILPAEIVSQGEALFSRAPTLEMDGADIPAGERKLLDRTSEHVAFASSGAAGGYGVRVKTTLEFDGFAWVEVELEPRAEGASFKSLVMTFPFRKEASTLFNAMVKNYENYRPGDSGAFRDYRRDLFLDWTRTMFVGNDRVGFEWFCEELADWNLAKHGDSLRLVKGERENLLVLTLADLPSKPGKTYRYRFGYQAQPVKAVEPNWRRVRAVDSRSLLDRNATAPNFAPWFPWETVHNVPEARYAFPDVKERRAKVTQRTETALWYFAGFSVSPFTPVWKKHGPEWTQTPPAIGTVGQEDNRQWGFARSCPVAEGYVDYYVWNLEKAVREMDMEGLYFDNQDPQFCDNALHGCGWTGQDGRRYRTYNLLATRELVQRIWRMYKRVKPKGRIMRHMTQKNISPVTGYADWLCDGECFCGTVGREESYKGVFDPEMFRAQFRTAPYGIPRYYGPEFQRSIKLYGKGEKYYHDCWEKPEDLARHQDVIRHFLGYLIVHDAIFHPHFGVYGNEWYEIQDSFGFDGTERFLLYTDPASPFAYDGGRLMASVYFRPEGKVLVAIMNDTEKPLASLPFDRAKLSALAKGNLAFRDAEKGTPVALDGDAFVLPIPARDYRLLTNAPARASR